jgi:hypothetical protein
MIFAILVCFYATADPTYGHCDQLTEYGVFQTAEQCAAVLERRNNPVTIVPGARVHKLEGAGGITTELTCASHTPTWTQVR